MSDKSNTSRVNGRKSKGPVTAQGKINSSRNALHHGLAAKKLLVLETEDEAAFQNLVDAYFRRFQPADEVEADLVLEMVANRWRLRRIWSIETSTFEDCMRSNTTRGILPKVEIDPQYRLSHTFGLLANNTKELQLLQRYETRCRRAFEQAYETLRRLQAERNQDLPNEPGEVDEPMEIRHLPQEPDQPEAPDAGPTALDPAA